jgi:hypothetical protein
MDVQEAIDAATPARSGATAVDAIDLTHSEGEDAIDLTHSEDEDAR